MPKVANYFVRPEGVVLSPATVGDIQYGEERVAANSQPSVSSPTSHVVELINQMRFFVSWRGAHTGY